MMNWNIQLYRYFNLWTVVACIQTNIIWVHLLLFAWVSMQIHLCFRKLLWTESYGLFFLKSRDNYRQGEEVVNNVTNNKDLKMLLCKSHNKSSKNCCHVLHLTFNCDDLQKILPSIENFFASFCFVLTVAFKSKLLLIFEFDMKYGK